MPFAIATEALFLELRDDRAVLGRRDRTDTPHLTLLWGTRSGELDLHLKWEDGRPEPYEPLFKIDKETLAGALAGAVGPEVGAMVAFWRDGTRAYRPGWLRRNGYVVTWLPPDTVMTHLREEIPRRKRKYRLDFPRLVSAEVMGRLALGNVYDPEILHILPMMRAAGESKDVPIQVYAQRLSERSPRTIHLNFHPWEGQRGRWVGMALSAFTHRMEAMTRRIVAPANGAVTPIMHRIHDALHLSELGAERWDAARFDVRSAESSALSGQVRRRQMVSDQ
jgi:hypothetical protein